jgi:hypothetical protein
MGGKAAVGLVVPSVAMGSRRVRPAEPKPVQTIVEWRYPKAHAYWDTAGKVMVEVESVFPGLGCKEGERGGFQFDSSKDLSDLSSAEFYWNRASVTSHSGQLSRFVESCSRYWQIVQGRLGVDRFTRMGHRTTLLYETQSVADATLFLRNFSFVVQANDALELGIPHTAGSVLRTSLEPGGRRVRIEPNAGTIENRHSRSKTPGVVVDVDISLEDVGDASVEVVNAFVQSNVIFLHQVVGPFFKLRK